MTAAPLRDEWTNAQEPRTPLAHPPKTSLSPPGPPREMASRRHASAPFNPSDGSDCFTHARPLSTGPGELQSVARPALGGQQLNHHSPPPPLLFPSFIFIRRNVILAVAFDPLDSGVGLSQAEQGSKPVWEAAPFALAAERAQLVNRRRRCTFPAVSFFPSPSNLIIPRSTSALTFFLVNILPEPQVVFAPDRPSPLDRVLLLRSPSPSPSPSHRPRRHRPANLPSPTPPPALHQQRPRPRPLQTRHQPSPPPHRLPRLPLPGPRTRRHHSLRARVRLCAPPDHRRPDPWAQRLRTCNRCGTRSGRQRHHEQEDVGATHSGTKASYRAHARYQRSTRDRPAPLVQKRPRSPESVPLHVYVQRKRRSSRVPPGL